jgi:hypothetical protein
MLMRNDAASPGSEGGRVWGSDAGNTGTVVKLASHTFSTQITINKCVFLRRKLITMLARMAAIEMGKKYSWASMLWL